MFRYFTLYLMFTYFTLYLMFRYFTLDSNLEPVGGEFSGLQGQEKDEDWEVIDYLQ